MGEIEDRLLHHTNAFDGLLSLIPGKYYYGQKDTDTQWSKRKQTKEESARQKKAKLDPDAKFSAAELRGMEGDGESGDEDEDEEMGEGDSEDEDEDVEDMSVGSEDDEDEEMENDMDVDLGSDENDDDFEDVEDSEEEEKKVEKKAPIKLQNGNAKKVAKKEGGKAAAKDTNGSKPPPAASVDAKSSTPATAKTPKLSKKEIKLKEMEENAKARLEKKVKVNGTAQNGDKMDLDHQQEDSSAQRASLGDSTSPSSVSTAITTPSTNSQSSPAATENAKSTKPIATSSTANATTSTSTPKKQPQSDSSIIEMKARLAARIEALRAARKADGPEGAPRSRQELMESRRTKELQRKEKKAKQREELAKEKKLLEELNSTHEHMGIVASSSRGTSVDGGNGTPGLPANYAFGRVMFDDGDALDASLQRIGGAKKRKGPTDAAAALQRVQAKKARIEAMEPEKKALMEEKERWGKALSKVEGGKVRDDEKLLKKSVKRTETKKRKSEREWGERNDTVKKAKAMKQKKREENLEKRKEQKKAGKGKGKKVPKKGGKKVQMKKKSGKGRPGFEGGLGAKSGGGGGGGGSSGGAKAKGGQGGGGQNGGRK